MITMMMAVMTMMNPPKYSFSFAARKTTRRYPWSHKKWAIHLVKQWVGIIFPLSSLCLFKQKRVDIAIDHDKDPPLLLLEAVEQLLPILSLFLETPFKFGLIQTASLMCNRTHMRSIPGLLIRKPVGKDVAMFHTSVLGPLGYLTLKNRWELYIPQHGF